MGGKSLRKRTCIGCRESRDKKSLLRICRSKDGEISADFKGNLPGRGAYVCSIHCLDAAMEKGSIKRSLRSGIDVVFTDTEMDSIKGHLLKMSTESGKE